MDGFQNHFVELRKPDTTESKILEQAKLIYRDKADQLLPGVRDWGLGEEGLTERQREIWG